MLGRVGIFRDNVVIGQGFIALAALAFGMAEALQLLLRLGVPRGTSLAVCPSQRSQPCSVMNRELGIDAGGEYSAAAGMGLPAFLPSRMSVWLISPDEFSAPSVWPSAKK